MIVALTQASEEVVVRFWSLAEQILEAIGRNDTTVAIVHITGALLSMILAYLLGSINPAILISRWYYKDDIRRHGSGNAGATNMLRTFGKGAATATFSLDLLKAAIAVLLGLWIWGFNGRALAGFFVMFGHMFPVFHRFNGGKGVACLAMVVLLISPLTFLFLLAIFLVGAIGTRMVSFGSMMAALLYPLILQAFYQVPDLSIAMAVFSAVFVVFAHRENIKRIREGTEHKLEFGKNKKNKKKDQ